MSTVKFKAYKTIKHKEGMKTKVFTFKWTEGKIKRLFESFSFEDGMKKVLSFIQAANKEGFEISGFSTSIVTYLESKNNINLRSF